MNLELRSIVEAGNLAKERITFRAKANLDVGDFLVAQSGYVDSSPTTYFFNTYWFAYHEISQGDLVILYTKHGVPSERPLSTGKRAHFFYWGLDLPIWNDEDRAAVLLYAPNWVGTAAADLKTR